MSCIPWLVVLGASGVDGPISFLHRYVWACMGMCGYEWVRTGDVSCIYASM